MPAATGGHFIATELRGDIDQGICLGTK